MVLLLSCQYPNLSKRLAEVEHLNFATKEKESEKKKRIYIYIYINTYIYIAESLCYTPETNMIL